MGIRVGILKLRENAFIPEYKQGLGYYEIKCCKNPFHPINGTEGYRISNLNKRISIYTGINFDIPNGYYMEIFPGIDVGSIHNGAKLFAATKIITGIDYNEIMITFNNEDLSTYIEPGTVIAKGVVRKFENVDTIVNDIVSKQKLMGQSYLE